MENEFKKVKNIEDSKQQSEAFGNFIDQRASNPLIIKQNQPSVPIQDTTFLDKISFQDDYFSGKKQVSPVLNPTVPS